MACVKAAHTPACFGLSAGRRHVGLSVQCGRYSCTLRIQTCRYILAFCLVSIGLRCQ